MNNIYIAGASSRARTTKAYLEFLYPDTKVQAFLVSPEMDDNPKVQDGIPVLAIGNGLDTQCKVYLGTRGVNHEKLTSELMAVGFNEGNIIPVSLELDTKLRNRFAEKRYPLLGKDFTKFDSLRCQHLSEKEVNACIYQASSAFDSKLTDSYTPLKEEMLIQVGAALTDKRIADGVITDNTGDNISEKNRQFCELTGLYWIWKHAKEDVVGLVHYRRHFLLPDNWLEVFDDNKVDVILPVPLYVAPNVEVNYKERHTPSDWDFVMGYIKDHYSEDYDQAAAFFQDGFYSPCNMFIARHQVLDELCSWMFPIIFALADYAGIREDAYQNRYPGFISERLITYFFESRRDKYRVVYADKNFLS